MNESEDEVIDAIKPKNKKSAKELEADIDCQLEGLMNAEASITLPNISEAMSKFSVAMPTSVPKLLECTPMEFMNKPLAHFKLMCEKHSHAKVISSLTYIQNITSQHNPDVLKRVNEVKDFIKL